MTPLPVELRALYPYVPHRFTTPAGAGMSYVDEGGQGDEAVLMLHGNPTWSFYYRQLIEAVLPHVRCVAPDHIGMGLSDKPAGYAYTLERRIADIEALVASLGLKRVHLVVHDWGGAIGFGFAARHPDLIGRIVVLNTAAFPSLNIPRRIALCKTAFPGTLLVRGFNAFAGPAVTMAMHRRSLTPEERRGFLYPYGNWADRVAVNAFVKDIPLSPRHRSHRTLLEVEAGLRLFKTRPVLIVWGGKDFCFDDTFYVEWRKRLPAAQGRYLPDAGHYVLADAWDEIGPEITGFLTAPGA